MIFSEGDYYLGEWVAGVAEGFGEYATMGIGKYVGEWKNNLYHGLGEEIFNDNSIYKGDYFHGVREG